MSINRETGCATDGLLARDLNGDGAINSGAELFGSATTLANGQAAPDGYSALNELDSNHDGVINSQDAAFTDLRVWVDANADGVTEQGELKTLAQLNISQLSLATDSHASLNNGNVVGLNSSYQTTDGASHAAADVWFQVDLRAQVTNLTQAMAQFNAAPEASATAAGSLTDATAQSSEALPTLAVANLVDAMKQYDAQSASVANAVPGSNFLQDTANLAKVQIAQSAATDLLSKTRPETNLNNGILTVLK